MSFLFKLYCLGVGDFKTPDALGLGATVSVWGKNATLDQ
jgi:hypothetical protein